MDVAFTNEISDSFGNCLCSYYGVRLFSLLLDHTFEVAAPTVLESQILPTSGIVGTDSKQSAISATVIDEPGRRFLR